MTIEKKLLGTSPSGGDAPNVADVFSTYLYEGTGSTQTINNGIDLAGEGGMVWVKSRTHTRDNSIIDTERGEFNVIVTNNENDESAYSNGIGGFSSSGFTVTGVGADWNATPAAGGDDYVTWTFRKAPRFFDVVTYTGDGVAGREIAHDLGVEPGMIIVKQTDNDYAWYTYHRSTGSSAYLTLNTTGAASSSTLQWDGTDPTDTHFTLGGHITTNYPGKTHIAYIFAHDPVGADDDGMIACGSYTGNGSSDGPEINLGWEPQYVLVKDTSTAASWRIIDSMRGAITGSDDRQLRADTSSAEFANPGLDLTGYGFKITAGDYSEHNRNGSTFIYMAIRGPMMKEPESGTEVFAIDQGENSGSASIFAYTAGFPIDMAIHTRTEANQNRYQSSRLMGGKYLLTNSSGAEVSNATWTFDSNTEYFNDYAANTNYAYMFKRAKGFFDVVAYTGTGTTETENHSLGVAPEMMLHKRRSTTGAWYVYHSEISPTYHLRLDQSNSKASSGGWLWNNTAPTDTVFTRDIDNELSSNGETYITYLFATLAGVSKVGNYTGNGSSQTIDCGFAGGARFILIKGATNTENWYVFDSVRGIVAGNDPRLQLDNTSAEFSNVDLVDPHNSGFIINSGNEVNASGIDYIFLAIA